jgi:predicted DNA-binding transcriptional regulator AlpA
MTIPRQIPNVLHAIIYGPVIRPEVGRRHRFIDGPIIARHMQKQKSRRRRQATVITHPKLGALSPKGEPDATDFILGPKLRAELGISAVTLWRGRHDEAVSFPTPKVIKGRLYFPRGAVSAWMAR